MFHIFQLAKYNLRPASRNCQIENVFRLLCIDCKVKINRNISMPYLKDLPITLPSIVCSYAYEKHRSNPEEIAVYRTPIKILLFYVLILVSIIN